MAKQAPATRSLPDRPNLEHLKKQAKNLLEALRAGAPDAARRFAALDLPPERAQLHGAQLVIAREFGFASWARLKGHIQKESARGFDVNTRCRTDNACALHFAAEQGHLDIVKRLVEAGSHTQGEGDDHEMGVVGWATCLSGLHDNVADYLLQQGAQLHIFAAVALNRTDDVRRIVADDSTQLEAKMSRNEHHRRPLHLAVIKSRPAMVKLLLDLGADVNAADDTGATPISCAAAQVDPEILHVLERAGAKLDLVGALRLKRYDLAEAIVADEPDRLRGAGGAANALHLMAYQNDLAAVRWLIDHSVDLSAKRVFWGVNHTPLHLCMEHGRAECAELLLKAGADPNIPDDTHHSTALGWAEFFGRRDLANLIKQHGGV
jgi:ankyrin repeat protein